MSGINPVHTQDAYRYRSQIREVINRNAVISLAMEQGYNAFLPAYDGGIDFVLYHEENNILRKVQLKSRWTIDRKYVGRDIWVAFPIAAEWYLMPHDAMLETGERLGITATNSWLGQGNYSKPRPSKALVEACRAWRFGDPAKTVAEAAQDAAVDTGGA